MKEIIKVEPLEDYKLLLTFDNNEKRIKDMKPYLNRGIFKKLRDINFFNKVDCLQEIFFSFANKSSQAIGSNCYIWKF